MIMYYSLLCLPWLAYARFSTDSAVLLQTVSSPLPDEPVPSWTDEPDEPVLSWTEDDAVLFRGLPTGREAVVMIVKLTDECTAKRVYALLATAGPTRDVWLMYEPRHATLNQQPWPRLVELGLKVQAIPIVGLVGGWPSMWSQRSHMAKSGFLIWAARHQAWYDYFWHVEEDAFYTGPWSQVFDSFAGSDADLVCRLSAKIEDFDDHINVNRTLRSNRSIWSALLLDPKLNISSAYKSSWPVLRISRHLAADLTGSLFRGDTYGSHELILHPFCQSRPWCTLQEIPVEFMGFYHLAGGRDLTCRTDFCRNCTAAGQEEDLGTNFTNSTISTNSSCGSCTLHGLHMNGPIERGKLLHPVKCEPQQCGAVFAGNESLEWSEQADRWAELVASAIG